MLKNIGAVSFGIEVKKRLLDMRKTQVQLASELKVNPRYLNGILNETSKRKLTADMKQRILNVLEKWEREQERGD